MVNWVRKRIVTYRAIKLLVYDLGFTRPTERDRVACGHVGHYVEKGWEHYCFRCDNRVVSQSTLDAANERGFRL